MFINGHALVIGVGSYKYELKNVPLTAEDAREVAAVISDPSYCGYPQQKVTLLHDESATRGGILEALDKFAQLEEKDTLLLFYGGHGHYGEDGYYLTTHETRLKKGRVVAGTGIRDRELLAKIKEIKAKRVFLIFNACHAGEVSPASLGGEAETLGHNLPDKEIEALLGTGEGRVIITACRQEQKSWFVRNEAMTTFAKAFTEGLRGGDIINRKGYISIFDLYEYVFNRVKAEVKQRWEKVQEPELTIQKGIGAMAVALHGGKTPGGNLGEDDLPTSLHGKVREIEPATSAKALQQILTGEVNLAATGDIENVTVVRGDTIDARGSQGFINKPAGTVTQDFGNKTTIDTGGGDYAGRDMYKSSSPSPSSTVSLQEAYQQVQRCIKEAEAGRNEELAEDLQAVEISLGAALKAEGKGNSNRRKAKLKEARQGLQGISATYQELRDLVTLLKQVR